MRFLSVYVPFLQLARYYRLFITRQQQPSLYYFHSLTPHEKRTHRTYGTYKTFSPISPISPMSPILVPDAFPIRSAATLVQYCARKQAVVSSVNRLLTRTVPITQHAATSRQRAPRRAVSRTSARHPARPSNC